LNEIKTRKLLNIEKEIFTAQEEELLFEVHVERESVSFDKNLNKQTIHFNISLLFNFLNN
jgi:hypothetical protein